LMGIATSSGRVAFHYVIIEVPPPKPDQGLPGGGGGGEHPEVQPPIAPGGPPTAQPKAFRR
jgi:hypothetical protein